MKLRNYSILPIGLILAVIGWIELSDVVIVIGYTLTVVGLVTIFCKGNIKTIIIICTVIAVLVAGIIFFDWMHQTKPFDFLL